METENKTARKRAPKPDTVAFEPDAQAIAPAPAAPQSKKTFIITDSLGRTLEWKAPGLRQTVAIHALIPADYAHNQFSLETIMLCSCVRSINGFPQAFPTSWAKIEARMDEVENEGYIAIRDYLNEEDGEQPQTEADVIETAKK